MKSHLLIAAPSESRGGAEEYLVKVVKEALKREWRVTVAIQDRSATKSIIADVKKLGAEIDGSCLYSSIGGFVGIIRQYAFEPIRLALWIKRKRAEAIVFILPGYGRGVSLFLGAALIGLRFVAVFQLFPERIDLNRWKTAIMRWCLSRNQVWVAVSNNNRRHIADSFEVPEEKIQVIHNGRNFEQSLDDPICYELRKELKIPDHARLVVTVARLHGDKGYSELIEKLPELVAMNRDPIHFLWVGDGPFMSQYSESVANANMSNHVTFAGYRSDVFRILRCSDLFLFPTLREGLPFAVLEAMAAGCRIVSSDASGISEIIEDGRHGVLFPVGDFDAMVKKVRWAFNHEHEMVLMADAAKQRVKDFSEERMLRMLFDKI